jgi:D-alanyl-D-alanine carboxypeptidase
MTSSNNYHDAANIFPMMPDDQLKQLAEDIRKNGQREPVVYYQDKVLDGRNRIKACELLGIEPDTCEIDDDDKFDPIAYVVSVNLHRRHLNETQRADAAATVRRMYEPAAKERQRKSKGRGKKGPENLPDLNAEGNGDTRDQVGAMFNVSGKLVDAATTVHEHGSSALKEAVKRGDVAVSRAAKVAKTVPKQEQLAVATEKPPKAPKKTPLDHLKDWWRKSDSATKKLFRQWIDGVGD